MRTRTLPFACALAALACARADRIELNPSRVAFVGLGKATTVKASPYGANGRFLPDPPCAWSTSDAKVATVVPRANEVTITAAGPGNAVVRCTIGGAVGELPVEVRVVSRVAVKPEKLSLTVGDTPTPTALTVEAFDDRGGAVVGRAPVVTCASEQICRGDARGQVWPVGPGETTARVEVEGAVAQLAVQVKEGRSADGKPKAVKGNPMEEVERLWNEKQKKEAAEAAKREREAAKKMK
jgi:ribosomal protein S7